MKSIRLLGPVIGLLFIALTMTLGSPAEAIGSTPNATVFPSTGIQDQTIDGEALRRALLSTVRVAVFVDAGEEILPISGSGTILTPQGHILTSYHVIGNEEKLYSEGVAYIAVNNPSDPSAPATWRYKAELVKGDAELDLAVLKIVAMLKPQLQSSDFDMLAVAVVLGLDNHPLPEDLGLTFVEMADTDSLQIGDEIGIVGFPGLAHGAVLYTRGIVSGFLDEDGDGVYEWIMTDTFMHDGNSGGLTINAEGQMIGIPTGRKIEVKGSDMINLIRPLNLACPLLEEIIECPPCELPMISDPITAIKSCSPAFSDDFSGDEGEWDTESDGDVSRFYAEKALHIKVLSDYLVAWSDHRDVRVIDFLLEVDTAHVAGPLDNEFGILFRYVDGDNFYEFAISSDGFYGLWKQVGDEWQTIIRWTRSGMIHTGEGSSNRIGVLAQGKRIVLLVNGKVLAEAEDDTFAQGRVALVVGAFEEDGVEIAFDNLRIWDLGQDTPRADAVVKASALNVRRGPGTEYDAVDVVRRGDELEVIAQAHNCDWLKVVTSEGVVGWVSGKPAYIALNLNCSDIPVADIIHVRGDGTGDYPTLEEAVRRAPAGATIRLGPGTYRLTKPLEIRKALRLIGAGMDRTEIVSDVEGYVVRFSGAGPFVAEDLTFRHRSEAVADVVVVDGGEVAFARSRFTGAVHTPGRGERAGLRLQGDTSGMVQDCMIDGNDSTGIMIINQAQPTLEGNTITDNTEVGIAYFDDAGGVARQNKCSANGWNGIGVNEQARPTLERNVCANNGRSGIAYFGSAGGVARANESSGNGGSGIYVSGEAQPALEGNICTDNEEAGIAYFDNAGGVARGNECTRNGMDGIYVDEQAQPTLEENICRDNEEAGIAYWGNAGGVARGNECAGNVVGIFIAETAAPDLIANDCYDNTVEDILDLRLEGELSNIMGTGLGSPSG